MRINLYFSSEVSIWNALKTVRHISKIRQAIHIKANSKNLIKQIILYIFVNLSTNVRGLILSDNLNSEIYIQIRNNSILSGTKETLEFLEKEKNLTLIYGDSVVKFGAKIWYEARPKYSENLGFQHDYYGDVLFSNYRIEYDFIFSKIVLEAKNLGIEILNFNVSLSYRKSKKVDEFGTPLLFDRNHFEINSANTVSSTKVLSIVIPTKFQKDGKYHVLNCVESVISISDGLKIEFIIVHHKDYKNSFDEIKTKLDTMGLDSNSVIPLIYDGSFNFSKVVNLGVTISTNEMVLILNDDVIFRKDSKLEHLITHISESPQLGIAGVRLINDDHELLHAGVELGPAGPRHFLQKSPLGFMPDSHNFCREISAVTGAVMLFRKTTFLKAGGFDERLPNDYNDIEFSLRLSKNGLNSLICSGLIAYHRESLSRGTTSNLELKASYDQLTQLVGKLPSRDEYLYTPATRLKK